MSKCSIEIIGDSMYSLLETFITVYETRSFTQSSKILYLSQPTVTFRIRKIERELGVSLFIRNPQKYIIPTYAADMLYEHSKGHIREWEQLKRKLQEDRSKKEMFKVGITQNLPSQLIPLLYSFLKPHLQQINLEISIHDDTLISNLVGDKTLDFGITESSYLDENLDSFIIFEDEMVLAGDTSADTVFIQEDTEKHKLQKHMTLEDKLLVKLSTNNLVIEHLKVGRGVALVPKSSIEDIPYLTLKNRTKKSFLGVSTANDKNPLVLEILNSLKNQLGY